MFVHIGIVGDTLVTYKTKVRIRHSTLILVYELQYLLPPFSQVGLVQVMSLSGMNRIGVWSKGVKVGLSC